MKTLQPGETYKGHITRIRKPLKFTEGSHHAKRSPLPQIGDKKGKLVFQGVLGRTPHGHNLYSCACLCGRLIMVTASAFQGDRTTSCGCDKSLGKNESSKRAVFRRYQESARKRNLDFSLTLQQVTSLTEQPCFYCGKENSNAFNGKARRFKQEGGRSYKYNGIDRMFNEQGYTPENCVPCCNMCNWFKRDLSINDFLNQCRNIYAHSMGGPQWDKNKYPSPLGGIDNA